MIYSLTLSSDVCVCVCVRACVCMLIIYFYLAIHWVENRQRRAREQEGKGERKQFPLFRLLTHLHAVSVTGTSLFHILFSNVQFTHLKSRCPLSFHCCTLLICACKENINFPTLPHLKCSIKH